MDAVIAFFLIACIYPMLLVLGWVTYKVFLRMRRHG